MIFCPFGWLIFKTVAQSWNSFSCYLSLAFPCHTWDFLVNPIAVTTFYNEGSAVGSIELLVVEKALAQLVVSWQRCITHFNLCQQLGTPDEFYFSGRDFIWLFANLHSLAFTHYSTSLFCVHNFFCVLLYCKTYMCHLTGYINL